MPPLQLRQEFPTLKAFKDALHAWAIEAHFEPRILKSDTGRVRVGCKRDPECPFVIRCNWERKGGREPLARVTVLRDKHTCLNGAGWLAAVGGGGSMVGAGAHVGNGMNAIQGMGTVEIRQDEEGNILGGARVLGPVERREVVGSSGMGGMVPVLPKVQRNSASRLPFLMEILPQLMDITKETTPVEIRECLLRKYGAEVHLQQCRRAKTEILKQKNEEGGAGEMGRLGSNMGPQPGQDMRGPPGMEMGGEGPGPGPSQQMFGDMSSTPNHSPFTLHSAAAVAPPVITERSSTTLRAGGDPPMRCPYCVNNRWMKSIKDAVEHMSMHVVM